MAALTVVTPVAGAVGPLESPADAGRSAVGTFSDAARSTAAAEDGTDPDCSNDLVVERPTADPHFYVLRTPDGVSLDPSNESLSCASERFGDDDVELPAASIDRMTITVSTPEDRDLDAFVTLDGREASPDSFDRRTSGRAEQTTETIQLEGGDLSNGTTLDIAVKAFDSEVATDDGAGTATGHRCPVNAVCIDVTPGPPAAEFDAPDRLLRDELGEFNASRSRIPNGSPRYEWSVRPPSGGSFESLRSGGAPMEAIYAELADAGTYTVKLRVEGANGYSDTATEEVRVVDRQLPDLIPKGRIVDWSGDPTYVRERVTAMDDGSVCTEGRVTGYRWEFPNGSAVDRRSADYRFEREGDREVQLKVRCRKFGRDDVVLGRDDTRGATVWETTNLSENVTLPRLRVSKVEQRTPMFTPLQTLAGCDNLGVIHAHVTGTETPENVTLDTGKVVLEGEKVDEYDHTSVYAFDRAQAVFKANGLPMEKNLDNLHEYFDDVSYGDVASTTIASALDRGPGSGSIFGDETVEVNATSGNYSDSRSTRISFTNLPDVVTLLANHVSVEGLSFGQCSISVMLELVGTPASSFEDGKEAARKNVTGSSGASIYRSNGGSGYPRTGPGAFGPFVPTSLASANPAINDISLGVGARVQYVAEGAGELGNLRTSSYLWGGLAFLSPAEGKIKAKGALDLIFQVNDGYAMDLTTVGGSLDVEGEVDLTSVFTGPFPMEVGFDCPGWVPGGLCPNVKVDVPVFLYLRTGGVVDVTVGEKTNVDTSNLDELGWDNVRAYLTGDPVIELEGGLGFKNAISCCETWFSVTGSLDTDRFQIYPTEYFAEEGVRFNAKFRWDLKLSGGFEIMGNELTLTTSVGSQIWSGSHTVAGLSPSVAGGVAGSRVGAVASPDSPGKRTWEVSTPSEESDTSPAKALLGEDAGTAADADATDDDAAFRPPALPHPAVTP